MQIQPGDTPPQPLEQHHWNTLYLLSAPFLILITLTLRAQTLILSAALNIPVANAGAVNAKITVLAELLELVVAGIIGCLSDRVGHKRIMLQGFLLAGVGAVMAPLSAVIEDRFVGGGLAFYDLSHLFIAGGIGSVWPQLAVIGGEFTDHENRPRLMAKSVFMMALGKTLVYGILMQIPRSGGAILSMLLIVVVAYAGAQLAATGLIDMAPKLRQSAFTRHRIRRLWKDERRLRLSFATSLLTRSDMVIASLFLMLWCVYSISQARVTTEEATAHAGLLVGLAGIVAMLSIPFWKAFVEHSGRIPAIPLAWHCLEWTSCCRAGGQSIRRVYRGTDLFDGGWPDRFLRHTDDNGRRSHTSGHHGLPIRNLQFRRRYRSNFLHSDWGNGIRCDGPRISFFIGMANLIVMACALSVMNFPGDRPAGENRA